MSSEDATRICGVNGHEEHTVILDRKKGIAQCLVCQTKGYINTPTSAPKEIYDWSWTHPSSAAPYQSPITASGERFSNIFRNAPLTVNSQPTTDGTQAPPPETEDPELSSPPDPSAPTTDTGREESLADRITRLYKEYLKAPPHCVTPVPKLPEEIL